MFKKFIHWFLEPFIEPLGQCSQCGKEFGLISVKYKVQSNYVLCDGCYQKWTKGEIKRSSPKDNVFYQKQVTVSQGAKVETIMIPCPACMKESEHQINLEEAEKSQMGDLIKFNTSCPYCGLAFYGSIQKQSQS